MTLKTTLALLTKAPARDGPSRLNPLLTEAQAVQIVAVQIVRNTVATFSRPKQRPCGLKDDIDPLIAKKIRRLCG